MEECMELKNNEKEIIFKDKYSMSLEENIFVAKRNLIDYIWKSANLEGIAVTYPQTEIISEGMAVNGMRINDINAIVNLKHAWQFTLENINYPLDFKFISQINKIIGDYNLILHSGEIRKSDVSMGGTTWKPKLPNKEEIELYRKALLNSVKRFAKDIRSKYLAPPATTNFGIMFLPTEGLYSEVVRNPEFFDNLRSI